MEKAVNNVVVPEIPPHVLVNAANLLCTKAAEASQLVANTAEKVDTTVVKEILNGALGYACSLLLPVFSIIAVPLTGHVLKKKQTQVVTVQRKINSHNQSVT